MYHQRNRLTSAELGVYSGILGGIAVLQTTEQFLGLIFCPLIGLALGLLLDRVTDQINASLGWSEEE